MAPNRDGRTGYVEAWDIRNGRKLWTAVLFRNRIERPLEEDVQWVFITKLEVAGGRLIATDERGRRHVLDLASRALVPAAIATPRASAGPRLVYVKGGAVWSVAMQADGRVARGATATKVLDLPKSWREEWVRLSASPDGKWLAVTHGGEGGSSARLIDLTASGRDRGRELGVSEPAFSPDGAQVAYDDAVDGRRGLVVLTPATGGTRLLKVDAEAPSWGDDRIACYTAEGGGCFCVLDAETGRQVYSTGPAVNPMPPTLSPDGRYLAYEFHLSRPVTGDTLVDIGARRAVGPPQLRGYVAGKVVAWSRDSAHVVWAMRAPDPKNDGSWLREDLWLSAPGSSEARLVARGGKGLRDTEAEFAPDQKHLVWFQRRGDDAGPGDIRWTPLAGGGSVTLVRGVRGFAVVG